ncbi:MAG: ATPase [Spirochaetaceae bacterium]|nr:ATPase [Spirochaetaceae bacterium]
MIVPMKKISLVVLQNQRKEALKQLRKVGIVHLEELQGSSEELSLLKNKFNTLEMSLLFLDDVKLPKRTVIEQKNLSVTEALTKAEEIVATCEEIKQNNDLLVNLSKELERFNGWGEVVSEEFDYLANKNIHLTMYEIPLAKYSLIPESIRTICVNKDKYLVRFLALTADGSRPEDMPAEAYAIPLNGIDTVAIKNQIVELKEKNKVLEKELAVSVAFKDTIKNAISHYEKEIEFENIYSGMNGDTEGNILLSWLTGYVPAEEVSQITALAQKNNWAYVFDDPTDEDAVPTQLKNNKFVSLIYPVTDFLGTVPGYTEYDISSWFLLFFAIFFGIIFGDAGYGLLMVLVAGGVLCKSKLQKRAAGPGMYLLLLLGLTTMAWGTITCSWFGIPTDSLPAFFKNIAVPALSNATSNESPEKALWVKQNLQILCFALALVQLSVAHIKGMVRYRKSLKCLGELGSLVMLWGIFYLVLNLVVSSQRFSFALPVFGTTMLTLVLAFIGVGFTLNFIFSNYEGNIGQSILESCKNIVSVLLGVVNVFSDIVSYIRLWAVGIAGGAIASTVNDMAGPMLGGAIIFMGMLLLVFGHGLNMILNVLSVIVHGVRLNTLEFSSHLGISWAGFKYKPFSE